MRRAWSACAALVLLGCMEERPVVLGVAMGVGETAAARLAIADAHAAGLDFPLDTVIVAASNNLAGPALAAAEQFVNTPGLVAVVGHSNSAASITASQIYAAHDVVQMAPHSTAPLYSQAGPHAYRLVPGDDRQGGFLAERLMADHAGARVAILHVNDDYGRGLRQAVLEGLMPGAVAVVLDLPHVEMPDSGATERLTAAIIRAQPDVVLWLGRSNVLRRVLPRLRAELGSVPVLGGDAMEGARLLPPDAMWLEVYFASFLTVHPAGPMGPLMARFHAVEGRDPTGPEVLTYDAVSLLLAAFADGARDGDALRAWLDSLGRDRPAWEGAGGPVRFDADGDVDRTYTLAPILGGG